MMLEEHCTCMFVLINAQLLGKQPLRAAPNASLESSRVRKRVDSNKGTKTPVRKRETRRMKPRQIRSQSTRVVASSAKAHILPAIVQKGKRYRQFHGGKSFPTRQEDSKLQILSRLKQINKSPYRIWGGISIYTIRFILPF